MKLGKEQLMEQVKAKFGVNTDDDTIALLENISDTVDDYENRLNDTTDWKKKYEDNDAEWRKKYTDRFFSPVDKDDPIEREKEKPKILSFDDLFKEGK